MTGCRVNGKQAKKLRKAAKEIESKTIYSEKAAYKAAKRAFNKIGTGLK